MQIYLVGGAVRDALMTSGSVSSASAHVDRDWVVVGASPQAMQDLGYLPVGRDFPVFLHPQTKEEYALARTERKTAPGYHGFAFHAAPGVTLEEDLARRDLTINAMAVNASEATDLAHATLIDPFGGQRDLQTRVLRHVTSAFAEDPVRILRLVRFAARFPDFSVAPETETLMRDMVTAGEVDHLVPERVWQELSRGLMEQRPSRMFHVLRACGALKRLLPEVDRLWGVPQRAEYHPEIDTGVHLMMVLDMSARLRCSLPVRFACLCHDLGKGTKEWGSDSNYSLDTVSPAADTEELESDPHSFPHSFHSANLLKGVCDRWRVPRESRELADVVAREHGNIHRSATLDAAAQVRLLERCDAIRRPERFEEVLLACECDARGRLGHGDSAYPQRPRLLQALAAAVSINTQAVVAGLAMHADGSPQAGPQIAQAIHAARVAAVQRAMPPEPLD